MVERIRLETGVWADCDFCRRIIDLNILRLNPLFDKIFLILKINFAGCVSGGMQKNAEAVGFRIF